LSLFLSACRANYETSFFNADCSLHVFGSSLSGFGLRDSGLDLSLVVAGGKQAHEALLEAHKAVESRPEFR
jgi:DNA polymerase sigma